MSKTEVQRVVLEQWMAAGAAGNADAVWKAIDWGASGAAQMVVSLAELADLGDPLEPAARAGVSELAASEREPGRVANRMADLMATLAERPGLQQLDDAERERLVEILGRPLPESLPAEVVAQLEARLSRARAVVVVFAVESPPGGTQLVGVGGDGTLVLLPKL